MKLIIIVITILTILIAVESRPKQSEREDELLGKCGYEGCPKTLPDALNIHLVPHTHDDVGWLKTVDQYYYGAKPLTQKAGVSFILDSVISELLKDKNKKFIYVESAFFFKWWTQQSKDLQKKVIELINTGQLEFIGGAWSMNDEATTHYQSLIDQFSHGLKKLHDTFGKCGRPRIGWQIDPFGHSKEMASIFAGMKFDGMFFARLDWRDKTNRLKNKNAEMIWHSSKSLGKDADLFTGILQNHYSAPQGFCFDYLCNDEPIIDDGYENNVESRLKGFYEYVTNMTKHYKTNHLMIPMGDDFHYQDASMYYKNIDKIIKYSKDRTVNGKKVNIFYSTPSCYLKALNEVDIEWPEENNDFFPYATDPYTYWAGYFSSRPTLKRYERIGNNILQVCKKLLASNAKENTENLDLLREAMGIMQHHDAITGTEKQHVADDYAYLLNKAIEGCDADIAETLNEILGIDLSVPFDFQPCHKLNESYCEISENSDKFMISIYNPLSKETEEYIRIPVKEGNFEVRNTDGKIIKSVVMSIPEPVYNLPDRKNSEAKQELIFKAEIKDFTSYYVNRSTTNNFKQKSKFQLKDEVVNKVENSHFTLKFKDNLLDEVEVKATRQIIKLRQEIVYFEGAAGNNTPPYKDRSSGAYIYRPKIEKQFTKKVKAEAFQNELCVEVRQIFSNWTSQVIRLYEGKNYIEFEWLVGPIPVDDKIGKEIVSRFTTDIESNDIFYTDSNGREMVQRKFNKTEEYEKIAANFYPITTKIAIEDTRVDTDNRLAILTDRAQGASCLKSGQCEILIHRRLLHDDAFGVGEALNETTIARGKFYVLIGTNKPETIAKERQLQLKKLLTPWPVFSNLRSLTFENWLKLNHTNVSSTLTDLLELPESINLLTFEPFGDKKFLIRLENIYEQEAGGKEETVKLKTLADHFKFTSIIETTLDGNQEWESSKRLEWKTKVNNEINKNTIKLKSKELEKFEFTIKPMQIKTFIMS